MNRSALVIIAILAAGGLAGVTWQTYRRDTPPETDKLANPLAAAVAAQIRQSPENVPDEVKQAFSNESAVSQTPTIRDYLAHRVRMLGDWPSPWPEVFWGAELALGASAAVVVALQDRQGKPPT